TVGLPRWTHSMRAHVSPVTAAAVWVVTKALAASPLAPRALPALKPNQPNHSSDPPRSVMGTLCGGKLVGGGAARRPPRVAAPTSHHDRSDERGDAGADVDDCAPREIEGTLLHEPAPAPHPVRERVVDERRPEQAEEHERGEAHPLRERAGDERGRDHREDALVDRE